MPISFNVSIITCATQEKKVNNNRWTGNQFTSALHYEQNFSSFVKSHVLKNDLPFLIQKLLSPRQLQAHHQELLFQMFLHQAAWKYMVLRSFHFCFEKVLTLKTEKTETQKSGLLTVTIIFLRHFTSSYLQNTTKRAEWIRKNHPRSSQTFFFKSLLHLASLLMITNTLMINCRPLIVRLRMITTLLWIMNILLWMIATMRWTSSWMRLKITKIWAYYITVNGLSWFIRVLLSVHIILWKDKSVKLHKARNNYSA